MKPTRIARPLRQVDRTFVISNGRRLSYFGGCDYFRLASHAAILKAVSTGLKKFGLNVSASRVTTGNHVLYEKLERELASFFRVPAATLTGSGSAPSLVVAQALAGQFSHALIDERSHASLAAAAQLLDCPIIRFKHRDPADLSRLLQRLGHPKPLVLTDGLFAHDGSAAPLKKYLAALPAGGWLLVDDAHGAGVLGRNGRGTPEHEGISSSCIIQTIALSKAFGVYGGAVLGTRALRDSIIRHSRAFAGATPLPLPLAHAALKSLSLFKSGKAMRARLWRNTDRVKSALRKSGISLPDFPGPIISIIPENPRHASRINRRLLEEKIHPPFIHYPGGPASGHFRFVISSEHSAAQLDALIRAVSKAVAPTKRLA